MARKLTEMNGLRVGDQVKIALSLGPCIKLPGRVIDIVVAGQFPDVSVWNTEVVRKVGSLGFLVKERMTMFRWCDENVTWKRVPGEIKS